MKARTTATVVIEPLIVHDQDGAVMLGVGMNKYQEIKRSGAIDIIDICDGVSGVSVESLKRLVRERKRKQRAAV